MTEGSDREWFAGLLKEESDRRKQADESLTVRLDGIDSKIGAIQKKLLGSKGLGLLLGIAVAAAAAAYPQVSAVVNAIGTALSSQPAQAAPGK